MADNRLFLIHQPTSLGVIICKWFGCEVYRPQLSHYLDSFYKMISESGEDMDDIILWNENTDYREPWEYAEVRVGRFQKFRKVK